MLARLLPLLILVFRLCCPGSLAADEVEAEFFVRHEQRMEHLFQSLDVTMPELAEVVGLWVEGERSAAARQLLAYYGQREFPALLLRETQAPADFMRIAGDALDDTFTLQRVRGQQPRQPNGKINWNYRGPRDDKEWAWMLNRHGYFISLVQAWRETGENRYLVRLDADLNDWLQQHTFPGRLTFSPAWRALEAARRILHSWNLVFFSLQDRPEFRAETRLLMLSSLLEHGENLRHHSSFWGGNHLLTEKTALVLLAAGWPEFAEAREWLSYAVRVSKRELRRQVYPDGAYQELSNHYQRVVARNALLFLQLVQASPYYQADEELEDIVEQLWNYLAYVMRPDGYGPLNNAGDLEHNRSLLFEALETFPRADWRYLAHAGGGQPPAMLPSLVFPWAGHAISRDRWTDTRHWSFFNMGPHGTAHQHRDSLHLSVFADQRLLLTDAGRYSYSPGPWRAFFKGPYAHNVLLLDSQPTRPQRLRTRDPMRTVADITAQHDFFSATATFPARGLRGPSYHQRSVYYLRGAFWLVVDRVQTSGRRQLEALWQFGPDVDADHGRGHLQLWQTFPALPTPQVLQFRGSSEPIAGWISPRYNVRIPVLQERFQFRIQGVTTLVWLIAADATTISEQLELLSLDNRHLHAIWHSPDGSIPIRFDF